MNVLSEVSPLKYSEKELLSFLLYQGQQRGTPVALWREPGSALRHVVISNQYRQLETSAILEDLEAGFLMAPFEKNKGRIFLPADMLFTFQDGRLKKDAGARQDISVQWLTEQLQAGLPERKFTAASSHAVLPDNGEPESFLQIVQKGIAEIDRGTFEKVVPSRTITVTLPDTFDVTTSFQKLCDNYPGALISFVTIPGVGSWLGASPELLVCVQDKTIWHSSCARGSLTTARSA